MSKGTMNFALSDTMRSFVAQRVKSGEYGNTSEYVRDLIPPDQREQSVKRLPRHFAEVSVSSCFHRWHRTLSFKFSCPLLEKNKCRSRGKTGQPICQMTQLRGLARMNYRAMMRFKIAKTPQNRRQGFGTEPSLLRRAHCHRAR